MLNFFDNPKIKNASSSTSSWSNINKEINKGNSKKFLKEMRPFEIKIIEKSCEKLLVEFGYQLFYKTNNSLMVKFFF